MTHTCNTGIELQCSHHNNIVAEVCAYIVRLTEYFTCVHTCVFQNLSENLQMHLSSSSIQLNICGPTTDPLSLKHTFPLNYTV